jgi:hypothetical protein
MAVRGTHLGVREELTWQSSWQWWQSGGGELPVLGRTSHWVWRQSGCRGAPGRCGARGGGGGVGRGPRWLASMRSSWQRKRTMTRLVLGQLFAAPLAWGQHGSVVTIGARRRLDAVAVNGARWRGATEDGDGSSVVMRQGKKQWGKGTLASPQCLAGIRP